MNLVKHVIEIQEDVAGASQGSISLDFRASADCTLFSAGSPAEHMLSLRIVGGCLVYGAQVPGKYNLLEMEDLRGMDDGRWHSVAIVVSDRGTRVYIDGYQAFCGTSTAFFADLPELTHLELGDPTGPELERVEASSQVLSSSEVLARSRGAEALVEFAANTLSPYDVRRLAGLRRGTVNLRFRVRGRMQEGVILACGGRGREQLRLSITREGLSYTLLPAAGPTRTVTAPGSWSDGQWHSVALVVGYGAVILYVDGYQELHAPGEFFLADVDGLDEMVIGQDCSGVRLSGEVQRASLYEAVLNDHQVKRMAGVAPVETDALFDRGFHDAASYRIPSILTLSSGVVLAGADQRVSSANDSPNDINFVVRRSLDGGDTWEEMATVIDCPGTGEDAASVIDSCLLQDPQTGRVFAFIDHFPGGIGQPNAWQGTGYDDEGRMILRDLDGGRYTRQPDGAVTDSSGGPTDYHVEEDGTLLQAGRRVGNIELAPGAEPSQRLFMVPTSYLYLVWSDDEGQTWSSPVDLNPVLKEPWMRFLGTCPGNGIALRHGAHAGRLVVPVYFNNASHWLASSAAVVYSDDHGTTWSLGASANAGRDTPQGPLDPATYDDLTYSLHEATVVEREDGSILMLMRNQHPSGRVARTVSHDGGQSWGPVSFDETLPEIWSQPNAVNLPSPPGTDLVVFANASRMLPFRGYGVLRVSLDGGDSWWRSRTFNPGHYVYQCMCPLPDGAIGLLWENECQGLYLTRLPLSWFSSDLTPRLLSGQTRTGG